MTYAAHRYRSACGRLDLFARDYPGEGPPLLLMHGLTRNSADFEPLAQHLAGRHRLIVADQRGRGLSEYDPEPANYRPDIYARDMIALLDSLEIERAGLIGTSMGGLIAMLLAATDPARVSAIVLNDVGPKVDAAGIARIASYVGPADAMTSWSEAAARCEAINRQAFPGFEGQDWLDFAARTCRERPDGTLEFAYDPAISAGFGSAGAIVPPDMWPLWDLLNGVPILLVRGALSDLLALDVAQEMGRRHSGAFAFVEVPGRGHAPMLDEPEALEAIGDFLTKHIGE